MMSASAFLPGLQALDIREPRFITAFAVLLLALWAIVRLAPPMGFVVSIMCAAYALKGPKQTIQAFTILAFLILLGKSEVSFGRWLVLFAGCGRMIWDVIFLRATTPRVLWFFLLFFVTIMLFAFLVSYMPIVSAFKVISFTIGVGTIFVGFHQTPHLRQYWYSWFYTFGLLILLASLPLYLLGMGYGRNGVGFQGILTHPQTFGPVLAPITAMLTSFLVFKESRSRLLFLGVGLGWFGMYASQSRTAMLATILSLGLAILIGIFKDQWRPGILRGLSRPLVLVACVLVFSVAVVNWGSIQEEAVAFLLKNDSEDEVMQEGAATNILAASRGEKIALSMENFRSAPITGIGFGVPSDPEAKDRVETGFLGLPTGASVEKGFMPSAVLEETGLTGAVFVLLILFMLIRSIVAKGSITLLWMFLACLLINLGEMVFFSVGGMGFYFWMIMIFCYSYAESAPMSQPVVVQRPVLAASSA